LPAEVWAAAEKMPENVDAINTVINDAKVFMAVCFV
jgi:hypothetical protein